MDTVTYTPARLGGTIAMPPSKSAAHRAILCAALARGVSTLSPIDPSQDMLATMEDSRALRPLPGPSPIDGSHTGKAAGLREVHCRESGSTLRFCIPIAAALGMEAVFTGSGRLPQRPPLVAIWTACPPTESPAKRRAACPLPSGGKLQPGDYALPGNISSQFITGLLYALPLLNGDSRLTLTTPLESAAYVDMTLEALRAFGIVVRAVENGWEIPGNQQYRPGPMQIEGDWSQAAFYLAMGGFVRRTPDPHWPEKGFRSGGQGLRGAVPALWGPAPMAGGLPDYYQSPGRGGIRRSFRAGN